MPNCKFCSAEIDFVMDLRGKWRAVQPDYALPEVTPGMLLAALDENGTWQQLRKDEVRAVVPHSCGKRFGWGPRNSRPRVELDPEPVSLSTIVERIVASSSTPSPPLIRCDVCDDEHPEGGEHRQCPCGRGPTAGFGACSVCLDDLRPDPERYPRGELATTCGSCAAPPQRPCRRKDGFPSSRPCRGRRLPVLWRDGAITHQEIEEERRDRRVDMRQLRDFLWDHGDVLQAPVVSEAPVCRSEGCAGQRMRDGGSCWVCHGCGSTVVV